MEKVYAYIDQNLDRFIEELFVLVRQPSISARWEGVEECSKLLVQMMENVGIHPRVLPMGGKRNPPLVYGEILNIPILSVPYGNADENNHAPNENLAIDCFKGGIRTTAALFFHLADEVGRERRLG